MYGRSRGCSPGTYRCIARMAGRKKEAVVVKVEQVKQVLTGLASWAEDLMIDFQLSEEQKALIETARRFTKEQIIPIAAECDRDSKFPMHVFKQAWEIGLVNTTCPAEYGGAALGELENALMSEELAYGCSGIQTRIPANVLALTPIKLAGNE